MIGVKKILVGGMDGDSSLQTIADDCTLNLMNGRVGVVEYGRNNQVTNVPGTTLINQNVYPPYGTNFCIGSCTDEKRGRLIYAIYNTFSDHGLYAYDFNSGITYAILYDSQVIGGLNFSKDSRIDRNMYVIGDLLYFTDYNNEPRRLNIEAAIKMNQADYVTDVLPYSYPMNPEVITIIRRPPFYPVNIEKLNDPDFDNNFIANGAFQFAVRYFYRDFEYSCLGAFSELAPYNTPTDDFNYVQITMPQSEIIDQDVLTVELVVRLGDSGGCSIIKVWNKEDINAHNTGTSLTFDYYANIAGLAIGLPASTKPFDSVPLISKSIEFARNRNFLANNIEGYDTPATSSLTLQVVEVEDGQTDLIGSWYVIEIEYTKVGGDPPIQTVQYYVLYVEGLLPAWYYFSTVSAPPTIPPNTIILGDADYSSNGLAALIDAISVNSGIPYDYYVTNSSSESGYTATASGGTVVLDGARAFKSNGTYRGGVVFFDKYRRKCGVVFPSNNSIVTPDRSYDQTLYNVGINWALSNANSLNEIPDWAYYYAPVRTQNLTTRYFLQARANSIFYVRRDSDGVYDFTGTTYSDALYGVAIDISSMIGFGFGYVFEEGSGDLVNLYFETGITGKQTLPIIAQSGKWLILKLDDFGAIGSAVQPLFEIYTPYSQSINEPYYEVGQIYQINTPTTSTRSYSTVNGTFNGDIFIIQRTLDSSNYFTENMSPNDSFYQNWYTDIGWGTTTDEIGQQTKISNISWSNTIIEGTRTNGLSSFDALDERTMPSECGAIQKIILASKIGEIGKIMLAICTVETISLYLSETQVLGASANAFLAESTNVIGTINVLQGSYGTVNPESVIRYLGLVFYIDANNGAVVQYSPNGLDRVSDYKQRRFFQRYLNNYLRASTGNLDNINGFHHLATGIDPFNKEMFATLPALIYTNYATILPSYNSVPSYATSIINRFDIYDQLGKTMCFKFDENKWGSNFEYMPEWTDYLQDNLFGFKNGALYIMNNNTTNWNTFFGATYPVRVCVSGNAPVSGIKNTANIRLEASAAPNYTVVYSPTPNIQITDLADTDYINNEGVLDASVLMDRLSPNSTGTADEKLYKGDWMISDTPLFHFEFQQYNQLFFLNFINIYYNISRGQKNLMSK